MLHPIFQGIIDDFQRGQAAAARASEHAERQALKARTPYPMFCRSPETCADKNYCQAEICCVD